MAERRAVWYALGGMNNQTPTSGHGVPDAFLTKFGQHVTGILCGFDRLRFRGTLRMLFDPAKMAEEVKFRGYTFPYLYDETQATAKAYRAACTPDFYLFDRQQKLFDETMATNLKGAYFTVQKAIPLLPRGASIVLNASINAHLGMPGSSVYGATKAALVNLAKTLSADLLPRGIRVNVVSPGPVTTPITRRGPTRSHMQALTL